MAVSAGAIRAGRAFIELFADDEQVQATLQKVQGKLKSFGATVDAVGAKSFKSMATSAVAATTSASTSVATLNTTTATLGGTATTTGLTLDRVLTTIRGQVLKTALSFGALSIAVKSLAPNSSFKKWMDSVLDKSRIVEGAGGWSRFFGAITGSKALREFGVELRNAGYAMDVFRGYSRGGLLGGLGAGLGVLKRFSLDTIKTGAVSAAFAPFRMGFSMLRGSVASVIPALDTAENKMSRAGGGALQASGAFQLLGRGIRSVITPIMSVAGAAAGFTAAISVPALAAARSFATTAAEIQREAAATGESVESLITKRYGQYSLISPADIAAAAAVGNAMTTLGSTWKAVWAEIGAAATPVLKEIVERGITTARIVARFIHNNRELIGTFVSLAAKTTAVAGAIVAVAGAAIAAAPAFNVLFAWPTITAGAVGVLSYLSGRFVPGVKSMAIEAFASVRDAAADAFNWLIPNFGEVVNVVRNSIGAITNALMAGDLQAAGEVAMTGLEVVWLAGTSRMRSIWHDVMAGMQTMFTVMTRAIGEAWVTLLTGLRKTWSALRQSVGLGSPQEAAIADKAFAMAMQNINRATAAKLKGIAEERKQAGELDGERLQDARERAKAALEHANGLKQNPGIDRAKAAASMSQLASGFGSFSTAGLGRIGAAGLSTLEKVGEATAKNTERLVELAEQRKGLAFA